MHLSVSIIKLVSVDPSLIKSTRLGMGLISINLSISRKNAGRLSSSLKTGTIMVSSSGI